MKNPLDTPGQVFDLAMMNPNPTSSKTKAGPVYRISFEVEREIWDSFMAAECAGMLIAAKATVVNEAEAEALEKPTETADKPFSVASELHKAGFFYVEEVQQALGSDAMYQDWCRSKACAICGGGDWVDGERRCEYAHVRRSSNAGTGIKPKYSGIPLCHDHHLIQHQSGEASAMMASGLMVTPQQAKEWFDKKAAQMVVQWAHERLKKTLGIESLGDASVESVTEWADAAGVTKYLPSKVKNHVK